MKLAYLGYDKTLLRTNTVLAQHYSKIDNYLIHESLEANNLNFFSLPIIADNVCIPTDESLFTVQHKSVLFKIKNEFMVLKKNIFSDYKLTGDEITGTKKSENQQFSFKEIESVLFSKKLKKYVIKTKSRGEIEYDYLILQGHQLVTDQIQGLPQNVLNKAQIQSYIVLNVEYSVRYKLHDQHLRHDFILIDNTNFNTVFDNWYICSYSNSRLIVSLIVPSSTYQADELLEFIATRTLRVLSESLKSFEFGTTINRWVSCVDGFVTQKLKLNHPKDASVFPSFDYWTQNKINNYIKNVFVAKNIKKLTSTAEKEL